MSKVKSIVIEVVSLTLIAGVSALIALWVNWYVFGVFE